MHSDEQDILDIHVAATFDCIDPDGGSEFGVGWNWLNQISRRVSHVTAVVNAEVLEKLRTDVRTPANVEFVTPGPLQISARHVLPLPRYYRNYAAFHTSASNLLAEIPTDIAHQITLGTPYWGSATAGSPGRRILGPAGISSPISFRFAAGLGKGEWSREAIRSALLRYPFPPVAASAAVRAADHVLAVDERTIALAKRLGRRASAMMPDGAEPLPASSLVPVGERHNIVWAGRMMARKGAPLVVRAFAQAVSRLPASTRLVMLGDGADMPTVSRLVTESGLSHRIDLPGFVPRTDTLRAIQNARALVFSSLRDTFGGVVLEAAERATPCVAPLHEGVDGLRLWWPAAAGWFGPTRSMNDMVDTMASGMVAAATCSDEDWNQKATAAYAFAREHDWDRRGEALMDVYRTALASPSEPPRARRFSGSGRSGSGPSGSRRSSLP